MSCITISVFKIYMTLRDLYLSLGCHTIKNDGTKVVKSSPAPAPKRQTLPRY